MAHNNIDGFLNKIIFHKYLISSLIGKGSFGLVYSGKNIETCERLAVKVEDISLQSDEIKKKNILAKEAKFMNLMKHEIGFPKLINFFRTETKRILIMTLLGENLENLLKMNEKNFSLITVLLISDQLLTRLESLHNNDIIHRDLKPENCLIGLQQTNTTLYLIDYGLSKQYRTKGSHISFKENVGLVGTARYSSINAHLGNEQSRRDDLESLGYIVIYLLKGNLPWMNLNAKNKKDKHKMIIDKKINTSVETLCKDLPKEFEIYMNYVKFGLKFDSDPNYEFLRKLFRNLLFSQSKDENEWKFDWERENYHKNNFKLGLLHKKADSWNSFQGRMNKLDNKDKKIEKRKTYRSASLQRGGSKFTNNNTSKGNNNPNNQTNYLIDEDDQTQEFNVRSNDCKPYIKIEQLNINPFKNNKTLTVLQSLSIKTATLNSNNSPPRDKEEDFEGYSTNETSRHSHRLTNLMCNLGKNNIKKHPNF